MEHWCSSSEMIYTALSFRVIKIDVSNQLRNNPSHHVCISFCLFLWLLKCITLLADVDASNIFFYFFKCVEGVMVLFFQMEWQKTTIGVLIYFLRQAICSHDRCICISFPLFAYECVYLHAWYIDASVWNIECWPFIMNSNSGVVEIVQSANRCLHTGAWGMGTIQNLNADLVALFQLDLVSVKWLSFCFPFNELSWLNYEN